MNSHSKTTIPQQAKPDEPTPKEGASDKPEESNKEEEVCYLKINIISNTNL